MSSRFKKSSDTPQDGTRKPSAPQTTEGDKRAFDARPKASEGRRREDSVRPTHHIDRKPSDPFDKQDGEE